MSPTPLETLWVLASTSTRRHAISKQHTEFLIDNVAGGEVRLASNRYGGTTLTRFLVAPGVNMEDIKPEDISLLVEPPHQDDAWLPSALYVLGESPSGQMKVLVAIPQWPPQIWLSGDPNDHHYPDAFGGITLAQVLVAV